MSIVLLIKKSPLCTCPIIPLLLAYMVGLVAGKAWCVPFEGLMALAVAVILLALLFLVGKRLLLTWAALYSAIFFAGMLAMNHVSQPAFSPHHISYWAHNQHLTVEGYLYKSAQLSADSARLSVKAQQVWANGRRYPVSGNLLVTVRNPTKSFLRYDRILFSSRLRRPRNFSNFGGFDFVRWLAFKEMYVSAYVFRESDLVHLGVEDRGSLLRTVDRFRATVRRSIMTTVSEPSAFLLRALLLGDRQAVPDVIQEHFSRSGTAHLLAISGLHVGIVAASCFFALRWLLCRSTFLLLRGNVPKLAAALSLLPVLAYTLIAGAGLSAQRGFHYGHRLYRGPSGQSRKPPLQCTCFGCSYHSGNTAGSALGRRIPAFIYGSARNYFYSTARALAHGP